MATASCVPTAGTDKLTVRFTFWFAARDDSKTRLDRTGEEPDYCVGEHPSAAADPWCSAMPVFKWSSPVRLISWPVTMPGTTRPFVKTQSFRVLLSLLGSLVISTSAIALAASAASALNIFLALEGSPCKHNRSKTDLFATVTNRLSLSTAGLTNRQRSLLAAIGAAL